MKVIGALIFLLLLILALSHCQVMEFAAKVYRKRRGQFLPWPSVIEKIDRGHGCIVVNLGSGVAGRVWWSPEIVDETRPFSESVAKCFLTSCPLRSPGEQIVLAHPKARVIVIGPRFSD